MEVNSYQTKTNIKSDQNDSTSTHSSMNVILQQDQTKQTSDQIKEKEEIIFIKNKKGRPMTDTDVIVDEITHKVYTPDDPEYKKSKETFAEQRICN